MISGLNATSSEGDTGSSMAPWLRLGPKRAYRIVFCIVRCPIDRAIEPIGSPQDRCENEKGHDALLRRNVAYLVLVPQLLAGFLVAG